jgi:hypothetical protein
VPSRSRLLTGLVLLSAFSACGSSAEQPAADVVTAFRDAIAGKDGKAACAVLAPRTAEELEQSAAKPCAEAILEEEPSAPVGQPQIQTYGSMAQAKYDGETLFLSRFDEGWLVTAAACTMSAGDLYDCAVKGG